jgi:hypothetical protein
MSRILLVTEQKSAQLISKFYSFRHIVYEEIPFEDFFSRNPKMAGVPQFWRACRFDLAQVYEREPAIQRKLQRIIYPLSPK